MVSMVSEQAIGDDSGRGFGRDFNMPPQMSEQGGMPSMPGSDDFFSGKFGEMVTEINAAVDLTVLLEMLGICLALALLAGMVAVVTIMRYEPLKILSNRD